jgi:hypothetical protein
MTVPDLTALVNAVGPCGALLVFLVITVGAWAMRERSQALKDKDKGPRRDLW